MSGNVIRNNEYGEEIIIPFENISPSTMTIVVPLYGTIHNMNAIFYCIPVLHPSKPATKAGDIKSFRWENKIRGTGGGFFKNSAFLEIKIDSKNKLMVPKLSRDTIQMCGCANLEMGREVAQHIVNHVNGVVSFIKDVEKDKQLFLESGAWLVENSKGGALKSISKFYILGVEIMEEIDDYHVIFPDVSSVPLQYIYFVTEIMRRCDDVKYLSELTILIDYYSKINHKWIADKISIAKVGRTMVKYNYHVGFNINREVLYHYLNYLSQNIPEGMEILRGMNMHADYVNLIKADVDVEIYSNYNNDENVIRKDKELRSKQTFCVRYSGNIMHSGPGGKAMEECYYVFIGLMKYLRPYIEIKDKR